MWVKALVSILSHLIVGIIAAATAQYCYDTGNFTANSTYGKNRDLILSSLPANVSANSGFFTATIGQGSDKVYALGMCSDDMTPDACYGNLSITARDVIAKCPNQKAAFSWGGSLTPCLVRYADREFLKILQMDNIVQIYNTGEIEANLTEFDAIWGSLIDSVVKKASMGSSRLKYATGEADLTLFHKIYSLMQCTPDLNDIDCETCLSSLKMYYERCCHGHRGGVVVRPSCWFRWDLYPFYVSNPATSATSLSPNATAKSSDKKKQNKSNWVPLSASLSAILGLALFSTCGFFIWKRKNVQEKENSQEVQLLDLVGRSVLNEHSSENVSLENVENAKDFPSIQLDILHAATNHFSFENKLGEGGFGPVYKGKLADGKEIAVKRLSKTSGQGLIELKNEVLLIARLQHRNLVRLLGCCLEKNEKLLVYEFMPNKSLDVFLFDPSLAVQLAWQKRFSVIKGIARGIMYLHEDSRLRIIHRDLKASNILLDHEMNPKISDFGMARLFGGDQNEANTNKIVGTYGYMAPEYAMEGLFSIKSDVYSFGVLLLEIISGKKNNGFHLSEHGESLLTFAWKLWSKGQGMELVVRLIVQSCVASEVLKCIHVGLLCVQADPTNRPTMSSVVVMLASDNITLPIPGEPAFYIRRVPVEQIQPTLNDGNCSANQVTISKLSPR